MTSSSIHATAFNLHPEDGSIGFARLLTPYRLRFALGIFYLIVTNVAALFIPRLVNVGVQMVDGQSAHAWFDHIASLAGVIVALAVIGAIARTFSRQVIFNVGRDVERDIRSRLFYHLSLMSSDFFARRSVGDLMTHLNSDINNVRMFTGFAALNFFNIVIVFCGTIPILISMDPIIAGAALLPFVLVTTSAQGLTRQMFKRVRDYQASLGKLTEHVQENLSGVQVIRLFHQEDAENRKFASTNQNTYDAAFNLAKIRVVMFPLMRMMGSLGVASALFVGGREVALGRITLGDYVEINARLLQLAWPAISFGFIMSIYAQGKASLVRLNDLFSARPTIVDGTHRSSTLSRISHRDFAFNSSVGQMLGIVGRSGSGKSTLLRALSRELVVPRGQIMLNDVDINDWNLEDLHKCISVVSSEPFLFSATLRENITFAKPDATDHDVSTVIEQVGLSSDLSGFADGLNTLVGERGVMLSGGQRQRVALARALLTNASLLLLDDCLSAVDSATESHIISELLEKRAAPWLILVSHRLAPMRHADEILVFDGGRIVDRGTHHDLIHRDGLYSMLWGVQQLQESLNE